MRGFLGTVAVVVGVVAVVSVIGLTIEWLRTRSVREWAKSVGGTFEAGGLLSGAPVPEAAEFDAGLPADAVSYRNVVRVKRRDVSFVVATRQRTSTFGRESKTTSSVVVLVRCPGAVLPQVDVVPRIEIESGAFDGWFGDEADKRPADLPVGDEMFESRFRVWPRDGAPPPAAEAIGAFLSRRVRERFVASEELWGADVRGESVRLRARVRQASFPYEEMFALAESVVGEWRR